MPIRAQWRYLIGLLDVRSGPLRYSLASRPPGRLRAPPKFCLHHCRHHGRIVVLDVSLMDVSLATLSPLGQPGLASVLPPSSRDRMPSLTARDARFEYRARSARHETTVLLHRLGQGSISYPRNFFARQGRCRASRCEPRREYGTSDSDLNSHPRASSA